MIPETRAPPSFFLCRAPRGPALAAVVIVALGGACQGTGDPNAGSPVGGPCLTTADCKIVDGAVCQRDAPIEGTEQKASSGQKRYPAGYCARPCESDADCPASEPLKCVGERGALKLCRPVCESDESCVQRRVVECLDPEDEACAGLAQENTASAENYECLELGGAKVCDIRYLGGACKDATGADCPAGTKCFLEGGGPRAPRFPAGICSIQCGKDTDCPAGNACSGVGGKTRLCMPICDKDADCARPGDKSSRKCLPRTGSSVKVCDVDVTGGACENDSDCPQYLQCQKGTRYPDGMCVHSCGADIDCSPDSYCVKKRDGTERLCRPACEADKDCRDGYRCLQYGEVKVCDTSIVGGACLGDANCLKELQCYPENPLEEFPGGYCSGPCNIDKDCPPGSLCLSEGDDRKRCRALCEKDEDCLRELCEADDTEKKNCTLFNAGYVCAPSDERTNVTICRTKGLGDQCSTEDPSSCPGELTCTAETNLPEGRGVCRRTCDSPNDDKGPSLAFTGDSDTCGPGYSCLEELQKGSPELVCRRAVGTECYPGKEDVPEAKCASGMECKTGFHATATSRIFYKGFCTAACENDADCGPFAVCDKHPDADALLPAKVCLAKCSKDDDCRAGYDCKDLSTDEKMPRRACVFISVGDQCTGDENCNADLRCFGGPRFMNKDTATGYCTTGCVSDDQCPERSYCVLEKDPANPGAALIGKCLRRCSSNDECGPRYRCLEYAPGTLDGTGSPRYVCELVGRHCMASSDCPAGASCQRTEDDNPDNNFCAKNCATQDDCLGTGGRCAEIDGVENQRACLPPCGNEGDTLCRKGLGCDLEKGVCQPR